MFFRQRMEKTSRPQRSPLAITTPDDLFTADELLRLQELWTHAAAGSTYLEFELDRNRIEFARWLIANGKLGEDY